MNAITPPQIEPRKAIVKRERIDENSKTWRSPRQAKRGRILVLEQKKPGDRLLRPFLWPLLSALRSLAGSLPARVHSTCHMRTAEEPVAMGTNGSRHRQTSCLQVIYPAALSQHSWGTGDDSPGEAALGKGQCWAEAGGSPLRDGVMGIGDTINGTSHPSSPG